MSTKPAAEIQLTIDGRPISVPSGTTIFDTLRPALASSNPETVNWNASPARLE